MKTFWLIAAALGGLVALFFAYKGNYENAFVAAALGAAAWFLSYRVQLKQKLNNDDDDEEDS